MDTDMLISAVFRRPCIWDKRRKDHANRIVLDNAWREISQEMNIEANVYVPHSDIEVGLFFENSFMKVLKTKEDFVDFSITKYFKVQRAYRAAGFDVSFKIRGIIVWRKNPAVLDTLLGKNLKLGPRLKKFCENITSTYPNYDVKVLYTTVGPRRLRGMAYIRGMCVKDRNCFVIKSRHRHEGIDLHEMGHAMGLNHEDKMAPCKKIKGKGFMANAFKTTFKSCYWPIVARRIRRSRCLREKNVDGFYNETTVTVEEESAP